MNKQELAYQYGLITYKRLRAINGGAPVAVCHQLTDEARRLWLALVHAGAFEDEGHTSFKRPYRNAYIEGLYEATKGEYHE